MSNDSQIKAIETAEKAKAPEAAAVKIAETPKPVVADVKVPAQPIAAAPKPVAQPAPVQAPAAKAPAAPAPAVSAKPAASDKKPAAPAKKAVARKAAKKPVVAAKPAPAKKAAAKKAAPVRKAKTVKTAANALTIPQIKEKIMSKATTQKDLSKLLDNAVSTVKTQAKAAYAKGSAVAGEVGELSKGNIEAVVESGKILANGVKAISADYVAETKSAYETATGDFKKLAAVKSPTELFQLQGELMRRNFDAAVAFGSKETEKFVKLSNDAFAPISNRVSLIVDKVSKAV